MKCEDNGERILYVDDQELSIVKLVSLTSRQYRACVEEILHEQVMSVQSMKPSSIVLLHHVHYIGHPCLVSLASLYSTLF